MVSVGLNVPSSISKGRKPLVSVECSVTTVRNKLGGLFSIEILYYLYRLAAVIIIICNLQNCKIDL